MYWPCEMRCFWQSRPNYICYHLHLCISVKCLNIVHFPVSSLPHIQWLLHSKTVDFKVCPGHIQRNRRAEVGAGRSTPAAVPPYLCSRAQFSSAHPCPRQPVLSIMPQSSLQASAKLTLCLLHSGAAASQEIPHMWEEQRFSVATSVISLFLPSPSPSGTAVNGL